MFGGLGATSQDLRKRRKKKGEIAATNAIRYFEFKNRALKGLKTKKKKTRGKKELFGIGRRLGRSNLQNIQISPGKTEEGSFDRKSGCRWRAKSLLRSN